MVCCIHQYISHRHFGSKTPDEFLCASTRPSIQGKRFTLFTHSVLHKKKQRNLTFVHATYSGTSAVTLKLALAESPHRSQDELSHQPGVPGAEACRAGFQHRRADTQLPQTSMDHEVLVLDAQPLQLADLSRHGGSIVVVGCVFRLATRQAKTV